MALYVCSLPLKNPHQCNHEKNMRHISIEGRSKNTWPALFKPVKVTKKEIEKLWEIVTAKKGKPKETRQINVMWYPGWDPGTEIGHYSKTMEIWVRIGFVRFLHCKILFSLAIHTAPSGRQSAPAAKRLRVGSYAPPSWKWRVYINYLEFFCSGNLSILPHF